MGIDAAAEIQLKALHVYVGYAFAINLCWRLIWGFIGNRHARWSAVLPFGRGYVSELRSYLRGSARAGAYLGHNPLGRLMVTPGSRARVDADAYAAMRAFRKPFVTLHEMTFYVLCIAIGLHLLSVVVAEVRSKSGLVSAMIHGHKTVPRGEQQTSENRL